MLGYMFNPMYFDPLYWMLFIPGFLLGVYAQWKVKAAFNKYSKVGNYRGMSGAEAAADMLRREGVMDVKIEMTNGWLSDHYDPSSKTLRLSPDVYNGRSVASVGIAAHEAGHALQHATDYAFLGFRSFIVPLANIGSNLGIPLCMLGLFFHSLMMIKVGVVVFGLFVAFQLITLPVEFNASSRAKEALQRNMVLTTNEEIVGVNRVLDAAALTYVAATIAAILQLLYFAIRAGLLGGRDDD